MMRDEEFFIGYAPPMPRRLARFVRRVVVALGGAAFTWAAVAAAAHVPLEGGTFEFGRPTSVSGRLVERPYPALQTDTADRSLSSLMLLVAPGKHGADAIVRGRNGQSVAMSGTRITRDGHTMLEVDPASLVVSPTGSHPQIDGEGGTIVSEHVELTGEIVDSKCFLGVMVPGSGKTHADCASLCLRGGIPPALHVRDGSGRSALYLLTGPSGEPLHEDAVGVAGQTVTVRGSVSRYGGWLVLRKHSG